MAFTITFKIMLWCQLCERILKRCLERVDNDPGTSEDTRQTMKTHISSGLEVMKDIHLELIDIFRGNDILCFQRYQEIKARMIGIFQRCMLSFNDDGDAPIFVIEWTEIDQGPVTSERKVVYFERIRDWFDNVYSGSQGSSYGRSEDMTSDAISLLEHYRPEVTMLNDHDGSADTIISLRENRRLVINIRD